ncbi:IclR family transcriptional regulator C-terminal domain-containing protein, partial [uncultured Pseudomonas sp.]
PRNVLVGQRLPMDITSLGRASLAGLGEAQRETLIATFCARRCEARGVQLEQEIRAALASVRNKGYCLAAWQPEVVAIATPLGLPGYRSYALNISLATPLSAADIEERYAGVLLGLAEEIRTAYGARC